MPATYMCPHCQTKIPFRQHRWAPWRAQEAFRCPKCATLLRLRPTTVAHVIRILIFVILLGGEVAIFAHDPTSWLHMAWLLTALSIASGLLILRFAQSMHWILPHKLAVCRDD